MIFTLKDSDYYRDFINLILPDTRARFELNRYLLTNRAKSRRWVDRVLSDRKNAHLKNVEVRVLAELMRNSRKSDRELAKIIGVSQPTVTRTRTRLEKEGIIEEYTMIPNFKKLDYQIMAFLFMGKQETMDKGKSEELRKAVAEMEKNTPVATLTVADGMGLSKGRVVVIMFKDYASYTEKLRLIRSLPNIDAGNMESFLIDLTDERNFRILSMKQLAHHIEAFRRSTNVPLPAG